MDIETYNLKREIAQDIERALILATDKNQMDILNDVILEKLPKLYELTETGTIDSL